MPGYLDIPYDTYRYIYTYPKEKPPSPIKQLHVCKHKVPNVIAFDPTKGQPPKIRKYLFLTTTCFYCFGHFYLFVTQLTTASTKPVYAGGTPDNFTNT